MRICLFVDIHMYGYKYMCVISEAEVGCFPDQFSFYLLRQGLSLNSKCISLPGVASKLALGVALCLLTKVWDYRWAAPPTWLLWRF